MKNTLQKNAQQTDKAKNMALHNPISTFLEVGK